MNRWSHWYPHTIATGALLLGCAIYLTARPASIFFVGGGLSFSMLGQLPSFLHTLAFALAGSLTISRSDIAISAIVVWGAIETLAELAQHDLFPVPAVLNGYQQASTFDLLDLTSILAAIGVAIFVTRMSKARNKVSLI